MEEFLFINFTCGIQVVRSGKWQVCPVNLLLLLYVLPLVKCPISIYAESYFYCQMILIYLLKSCTMMPWNYTFVAFEDTKSEKWRIFSFIFYLIIFCLYESRITMKTIKDWREKEERFFFWKYPIIKTNNYYY